MPAPFTTPTRLRRALTRLVLAVFALAGALLVALVLLFDPLVDAALVRFNRTFNGSLEVGEARLGPGVIQLRGVRLRSYQAGEILTAEEIALRVHPLRGVLEGHPLAWLGDVRVRAPSLTLARDPRGQWNLATLLPSPRPERAGAPLLVRYRGRVTVEEGWLNFRDEAHGAFYYQLRDWQQAVEFRPGQPARLSLSAVPDQPRPGRLRLEGRLDPASPALDVELQVEGLELFPLAQHPSLRRLASVHSGLVDGTLWVSGTASTWGELLSRAALGGALELSRGKVHLAELPWPVEDLKGRLALGGRTVRLRSLEGTCSGMAFTLSGEWRLPPQPAFDLLLAVPELDLEKLQEVWSLPATGRLHVELSLAGSPARPRLGGWLRSPSLRIAGEEWTDVQARFRADRLRVRLEELTARSRGAQLEAEGWVFLRKGPRLALRLRGKDVPLSGFLPAASGRAEFDLSLLGPPGDPVVVGSADLSGIRPLALWADSARGRFVYSRGSVLLEGGSAWLEGSRLELPYAFYDHTDRFFLGSLDTAGYPLPHLQVAGLGPVGGRFAGQARVWGPLESPRRLVVRGFLEDSQVRAGTLALDALRGPFSVEALQLLFPFLSARVAGGEVVAAGRLDLSGGGRTELVLAGEGIDLSRLARALPVSLPVAFRGRGEVRASYRGSGPGAAWWVAQIGSPAGTVGVEGYLRHGAPAGILAWFDGLEVGALPVPGLGRVEGDLVGMAGMLGSGAVYAARLRGPGLGLAEVDLVGSFQRSGSRIRLVDNLLSWSDSRKPDRPPGASMRGRAYGWFGPVLAPPLEESPAPPFAAPPGSSLALEGSFDLATGTLDLDYRGRDLDLAWVARRPWLPAGMALGEVLGVEVPAGVLHVEGRVWGSASRPRSSGAFQLPWLVVRAPDSPARSHAYSGAGRFHYAGGILALDQVYLSRRAYDPRLPLFPGRQISRPGPDERGLLQVEGILSAAGRQPRLDVRVSTGGWELSDLLALFPRRGGALSRSLFGWLQTRDLRIWGSLERPSLAGSLVLRDGSVRYREHTLPLEQAWVSFTSRDRWVRIEEMGLRSGPLRLEGRGSRDPEGGLVADLWAPSFPFPFFHYLGPPFTALSGKADLALHVDTRGEIPRAYLGMEGRDLLWNPADLGGTDGSSLKLDRLTLGRLRHTPEGQLLTGPGQGIAFTWSRSRVGLVIPPEALEMRMEGTALQASGAVRFGLPRSQGWWEWFASPAGPDFGRDGEPFLVRAEGFTMAGMRRLLGLPPGEEHVRFSGELALRGQWYRDHRLGAADGLPFYRLRAERLEVGSREGESWVGLKLVGGGQAEYRREDGRGLLALHPFHLAAVGSEREAGEVRGEAQVVLAQAPGAAETPPGRVELQARNLPLEVVNSLLPPGLRLAGALESLDLSAVGPLLFPDLLLAFRLTPGRLGPIALAGVSGGVQGVPGEDGSYEIRFRDPAGRPLEIFLGEERSPERKLTLSGVLPLRIGPPENREPDRLTLVWEGRRLAGAGELDLLAHLVDSRLGLLEALPGVKKAAGRLDARLLLAGTFTRPRLAGQLQVEGGTLEPELPGNQITDLNVRLRFEEIPAAEARPVPGRSPEREGIRSRCVVEQFQGLLGGSPFRLQGKAELAGFAPTFLQLALSGESLPLALGDLFEGRVDVGLNLSVRPGRVAGRDEVTMVPVLEGDVYLRSGDVTVPVGAAGEKAWKLPLRPEVDLHFGDDVWVHVQGLRVRARGRLTVLADPQTRRPMLAGELALSRGTVTLPFTDITFQIRRGLAHWDSSLLPTLEGVEADTRLGDVTITARIQGRLPDVRVDLVSQPPMAQAEIQRLLIQGGLPSFFTGTEGGMDAGLSLGGFVARQGVTLLSHFLAGELAQEIGRLFFLSEVSFDYIPPASYVVTLAKALDPHDRVLLTLTRVTRSGEGHQGVSENLFGVEWRFLRSLLVRSSFDELGQPRFWFQAFLSWE